MKFGIIGKLIERFGKRRSNMEELSKEELESLMKTHENAPKTKVLSKDEQQKVIDSISESEITEHPSEEINMVSGSDSCPHCDTRFDFSVSAKTNTFVCPNCGKTIPLCSKCNNDNGGSNCGDCIFCDVSNFYNYLRGKVTVERLLASLNPPLCDMTTASDPAIDFNYENYINDVGGVSVTWDVKYWGIYGMVINSPLSAESSEADVMEFVGKLIKKNRE